MATIKIVVIYSNSIFVLHFKRSCTFFRNNFDLFWLSIYFIAFLFPFSEWRFHLVLVLFVFVFLIAFIQFNKKKITLSYHLTPTLSQKRAKRWNFLLLLYYSVKLMSIDSISIILADISTKSKIPLSFSLFTHTHTHTYICMYDRCK